MELAASRMNVYADTYGHCPLCHWEKKNGDTYLLDEHADPPKLVETDRNPAHLDWVVCPHCFGFSIQHRGANATVLCVPRREELEALSVDELMRLSATAVALHKRGGAEPRAPKHPFFVPPHLMGA